MMVLCNELNAGYAANGYARSRGVGACVVTFTGRGLGVLNGIAGAYSENFPVICTVGGPNSNDYGSNRILHEEEYCKHKVTILQVATGKLAIVDQVLECGLYTFDSLICPTCSPALHLATYRRPSINPHPNPYLLLNIFGPGHQFLVRVSNVYTSETALTPISLTPNQHYYSARRNTDMGTCKGTPFNDGIIVLEMGFGRFVRMKIQLPTGKIRELVGTFGQHKKRKIDKPNSLRRE
eukprot:Gb_25640 [translate_table: standard]